MRNVKAYAPAYMPKTSEILNQVISIVNSVDGNNIKVSFGYDDGFGYVMLYGISDEALGALENYWNDRNDFALDVIENGDDAY